ncbi:HugZ family pyridoxamine 5'-phosphate oxidase [Mesorhizobium xinjiangense]|uniref:HugZ family pyridoxamine 5'-phosphate oxidase n=1 Tax=Mesorhizobium xinjiangense TaxID=2678685 RepID=UPI0012ECEF65|nr:HugZ family protein [Mesorhizobium xinjiangense]
MSAEKKDLLRETDDAAIRQAKTLVRAARYAALAVLEPTTGVPFASRVATATDIDGTPLILVSALSAHTGGLEADPRCSLLIGEPGRGDPLAHPRMTLICEAAKLERATPDHERARRRFLNRQPKAKLYVDFPDFALFRLEPQRASLNGGFGKAYALGRGDLLSLSPANEALAAAEQSAIDHMNADHSDAVRLYAAHFAGAPESNWTLTGIDAEGIDIAAGDDIRRIFFDETLAEAGAMRPALVNMARAAREALGK